MNLTLPNVIIFGIGSILMYAAIKGKDPRAVVKGALGQKTADAPIVAPTPTGPNPVVPTVFPSV